jgi:hypothetical protein
LGEWDTQLEWANGLGSCSLEPWESLDGEMVNMDKIIGGLIRHQKKNKKMMFSGSQDSMFPLFPSPDFLAFYFSLLTFHEAIHGS